jgi:organic radical activating enzyme
MPIEVENSDDYLDMSDDGDCLDMSNFSSFELAAEIAANHLHNNDREQAKLLVHSRGGDPKFNRIICNLIEIMGRGQVKKLCEETRGAWVEHPLIDRVIFRQKPEPNEDERFWPEGRLKRLEERQKRVHQQQDQLWEQQKQQWKQRQQEQRLREQQALTQAT